MVSMTVTMASQKEVLPPSSVTKRVSVLAPRSLQAKASWLAARLVMKPLSKEPPSRSAAVMAALPLALR